MSVTMKASSVDEREGSILDAFVDLADSLVDDYDPLDFLYRLLDHSIPLTKAAAGAVLLHYEGSLHLVAASNEDAETVGVFEVQNEQGPGRESFNSGGIVQVPVIADVADRWPDFVTRARAHGWTSAFAVPLRLRDYVAGSFVVFWPEGGPATPSEDNAKLLRGFADVATIAVLQQRVTADVEVVNRQLHTALESRIKVEQAKGMVAQATGVKMGEAFQLVRRHARLESRRVTDVAAAVITGDLDIDRLNGR